MDSKDISSIPSAAEKAAKPSWLICPPLTYSAVFQISVTDLEPTGLFCARGKVGVSGSVT